MMISGIHAVVGGGFGDEGKGHVVDWLCSQSRDPIVVRFSGGPQAAHNVVLGDGRQHVFQHFGSGTFRGAPTYWSKYCPVNPVALIKERDVLLSKDVSPSILIDRDCPVITPYEIYDNHISNEANGHGTCGAGIYATFKREQDHYRLTYEDLFFPDVLIKKMEILDRYYADRWGKQCPDASELSWDRQEFYESLEEIESDHIISEAANDTRNMLLQFPTIIFEGSQGLMLDKDIGFFPHVTPSNTGTKNIDDMGFSAFPWVVTRAYQTRHGNGPMSDDLTAGYSIPLIKDNPFEQNNADGAQGEFRKAILDLDMLKYAIQKDRGIYKSSAKLVINCLDIVHGQWYFVINGEISMHTSEESFVSGIKEALGIDCVYISHAPTAEGITKHNG